MTWPALRRCISLDPTRFAEHVWGSRPLLSRAADLPRDFTDLLTLEAVDEIVATRGLRTPFVRMAKDGIVLAPARFTGSGGPGAEIGDQLSADRVLAEILDGASLVLQGMHRFWPPLIAYGTALAAELGHSVQVNAYVTPRESRGFAAHYDVHDVFVLQVAGCKRWQVHAPVIESPLARQQWFGHREAVEAAARGPAVIEETLAPGDALYLPRGWVHAAQALGETSAHLTVGVHPVTRYDIVEAITKLIADDPELRRSLPLALSLDPAGAEVDTVRSLMIDAIHAVRPDDLVHELRRRVWPRNRPAPIRPLAQADAIGSVGPATCVRRRDALLAQVSRDADRVHIVLPDRGISLPIAAAEAVTALLSGLPAVAGELPGLDADDGVVVVRRLLREAVVVPVDDAGLPAAPGCVS
jgi:hypothetical protein